MRISLTLDDRTAESLRRRAQARNQSIPRYLTEMAQAEARREDDVLAEEGYRLLANDTKNFADSALFIAEQDRSMEETLPDEEIRPRSFLRTARSLQLEGPADWSANLDHYLYREAMKPVRVEETEI